MSRGINFQEIIKETRRTRDWQNIPVEKISRAVKRMPHPIGLVPSEKKGLVTIYLNKATVSYFKKEANKYSTKYQRMMRAVLDRYADLHR